MTGLRVRGSGPHGAARPVLPDPPTGEPSFLTDGGGNLVWLAEIEGYREGAVELTFDHGHGARPRGALSREFEPQESTRTFRVSNKGYGAAAGSPVGEAFYAPLIATAPTVERRAALDPLRTSVGAAWGEMVLANPVDGQAGIWDATVREYAVDGYPLRVLLGAKRYDRQRGLWCDELYETFRTVFEGVAADWWIAEDGVHVGLRDRSHLLERPVQDRLYAGTGGLEGTPDMAGLPVPKLRGSALNVTPVLVDPVARIYQYTDGPGEVLNLYERGIDASQGGIVRQGDTDDLYSGSTDAGKFRTDNSRGLLQLGSPPTGAITIDCKGSFPKAGYQDTPASIARFLLSEDLGLGDGALDVSSFLAIDAVAPFEAGLHVPAEPMDAVEALSRVLRSVAATLFIGRSGRLRAARIAPPFRVPEATYTEAQIVSARPLRRPEPLDPVVGRWAVGYARNHTVQASGLSAAVDSDRRAFLAKAYREVPWVSAEVLNKHRRPATPPRLDTILLNRSDAAAVGEQLGALWGADVRPWELEMAVQPLRHDLGAAIALDFPLGGLRGGRRAVVVGERIRPADGNKVTLQVLA
ncbi:hypothetical protein [Ferruginivarius sediminum]|uniref:Tip attachment protein J domain-containing protein n=1 Tax=Ferruginivarius sediminum TaxID=2661937 RepID=A0A369T4Q2_9PROT|nr:hypothetical protein [Ferruginivarius sediminum]RDD60218.1 hypothetical protein DRB17_19255 [Ferruginivarius sediminum]